MLVRRLARPLLAAVFIWGGIDTLRHPEGRVRSARPFLEANVEKVKGSLPAQVPTDPETLVRLDAAVKVGAGVALALGRFPRLSALLLAGSLVPTTLAAHSFWEQEDAAARTQHQTHFLKNAGLLGGLLLTAADRPGAAKAAKKARKEARAAKKAARRG
jgi:putative oxidoreductase